MSPRSRFRLARRGSACAAAMLAVAALAACGSSGDDAIDTAPAVINDIAADAAGPCVSGSATAGAVTVTGSATFTSVPNSATGALNYAGAVSKPIRAATVELLNAAGDTLASCVTNDSGAYAFTVSGSPGAVRVRVRAEMKKDSGTGGQWDFSVRDNTRSDALYVLDSPAVTPVVGSVVERSVHADAGFGGKAYTAVRAAGPFAILDVVFDTTKKVLTASPNAVFPPLRVLWSVRNAPANGSFADGNIGTSFYFFDSVEGHRLFLLGSEDVDTDEYDSHVVAHEWGHYFQTAFSRDDSLGGPHGDGDRLDMRVAFSEGWGNAWSGMALGSPIYADSGGTSQAGGFAFSVAQSPAAADQGWFSEASVQFLMFSFHQSAAIGFTPIFNVMSGPLKTSGSFTGIHNFATLLKAAVPGAATSINSLLQGQKISTANDAFGAAETNNGGIDGVLPIYQAVAGNHCVSSAAGLPNKLGNAQFVKFESSGERTLTLRSVTGQTGSDPDFVLLLSDGTQQVAEGTVADAEVLKVTLPAGTHTLALTDFNLLVGTVTGSRCFTLTIQ